ncbi:FAD-dependent oxidoreductase [Breoghania sp.]|uniref:FAD-dependent oxidoreductase n=1 Tax=Breoghania sp. TaxID=2065378 RepID=UPI002AAB250D|nr:FAD-dependent oxidoreductase [Breoghania sp.]
MSARVLREAPKHLDVETEVLVIGGGACGLVAALRAAAAGAEVIVVERDASPSGSTSMSSGFVPAPATRYQRAVGVEDDSPECFEADLMAKSKGLSDPALVRLAATTIGPALEWLGEKHRVEWLVLDDFLYPGHTRFRMHTVPEKTGTALLARLLAAVEAADIPIVTEARAQTLYVAEDNRITAVEIVRPDGAREIIGAGAVVLSCNGFGGNRDLVRKHIPDVADGLYYGHEGNEGDAIFWGEALGCEFKHLSGYQGHGSLAHPHGILISWALMMEGGFQVNTEGKRFSNENGGYSEQAVNVLAQPGGVAWNVYDDRLHLFAQGFPDYMDAVSVGAIREGETIEDLAKATGLPADALAHTFEEVEKIRRGEMIDPFGRSFAGKPVMVGPYYAVRVTGALFHTQGGLVIDDRARVMGGEGKPLPNLLAGGGAACGVSGPDVSGYLSGNGLLTAIAFGYLAGETAAGIARG